MAEHTELLPCPFCGGEAELVDEHGFAAVECISCDYLICESAVSEPIEEHWNTRAPDPSHADLVAAAQKVVASLDGRVHSRDALEAIRMSKDALTKAGER